MKKNIKGCRATDIFAAFAIVTAFALAVYAVVQCHFVMNSLKEVKSHLAEIYSMSQGEISSVHMIESRVDNLWNEVSIALGIITAGIGVFALFGGILSFVNIRQSKELDVAISNARKALENQQELEGARLMQEGRVYALKNHYQYAVDNFNEVIEAEPDTFSALLCEFEIFSLYADIMPVIDESEEKLTRQYHALINKLETYRNHTKQWKALKADTYFVYGCVCGNYSLNKNGVERINCLDKAIHAFSDAIALDSRNVDFYRNQAISYAVKNDVTNCKQVLQKSRILADADVLYSRLVTGEKLTKLFQPFQQCLSTEMKKMLTSEFDIQF